MKANTDVHEKAKSAGVYLWQIADRIGVHEVTLNRWLRKELPEEKKAMVMKAIEEIQGEN